MGTPQDWEEVEVIPGAALEALHKTGKSLKKLSAHIVVGAVDWYFSQC